MSFPATLLPPQAALLDLSRALGDIWSLLSQGIALWNMRERTTPLPRLAHSRAGRLMARLQAILALLAAGGRPRTCPPRAQPARLPDPANGTAAEQNTSPPVLHGPRLPQRVGWMTPKAVEIRIAASQLRHWMADPAIVAVLAEVPQARRPLAALCRMLALPAWPLPPDGPLPPPKPRVRKPKPPKPRRPTAAEDRAFLYHHRNIETDSGWVRPGKRPWWLPPRHKRR